MARKKITKASDLDVLPNGTVGVDIHGTAWQKYGGEWLSALPDYSTKGLPDYLPFVVLAGFSLTPAGAR